MSTSESNSDTLKNMDDFKKILVDLCKDLFVTFPELNDNLNEDLCTILDSANQPTHVNNSNNAIGNVFSYCKQVFPERFFDILYQNSEMFNKDSEINTVFLPGIDFKYLWNSDISDKTKDILWKYLQLILFSIVNNMSDGNGFGDTAKLFESINEDEFKKKLDETINSMKDMFNDVSFNQSDTQGENQGQGPNINLNDLPDPQQFHAHINGMMDGKLGKLAREIAEETASDLNLDPENMGDAEDYFKNLFKNPGKLMNLVKNVGDKLDHKIKSGQINERELLEEASNIVKRMKDMPGMENIQSMLSKMGIPNVGNLGSKNSKVNIGELQNQLNNNLKKAKLKERMRRKMDDKKDTNEINITNEEREKEDYLLKMLNSSNNEQIENLIFSTGEKAEKSLKSQNPNTNEKNKKNKNKNNKNK